MKLEIFTERLEQDGPGRWRAGIAELDAAAYGPTRGSVIQAVMSLARARLQQGGHFGEVAFSTDSDDWTERVERPSCSCRDNAVVVWHETRDRFEYEPEEGTLVEREEVDPSAGVIRVAFSAPCSRCGQRRIWEELFPT